MSRPVLLFCDWQDMSVNNFKHSWNLQQLNVKDVSQSNSDSQIVLNVEDER